MLVEASDDTSPIGRYAETDPAASIFMPAQALAAGDRRMTATRLIFVPSAHIFLSGKRGRIRHSASRCHLKRQWGLRRSLHGGSQHLDGRNFVHLPGNQNDGSALAGR
jgi:hypothetical protein